MTSATQLSFAADEQPHDASDVPMSHELPDVEAPVVQELHDVTITQELSEDAKAAEVISLLFNNVEIQGKVISALKQHNQQAVNPPGAAMDEITTDVTDTPDDATVTFEVQTITGLSTDEKVPTASTDMAEVGSWCVHCRHCCQTLERCLPLITVPRKH